MMRLNAQLSADREAVESLPGFVRMTVTITNDSNAKATPVNLYHGGRQIASIAELAPGQTTTVTREFNISQAGKFRFEVRTVDVLNNTVSFDTNEISIAYTPPTPAPTTVAVATVPPVVTYSPIPVDADDSTLAKGKNALFILTWVSGILLAAGLALFLISSLMRVRARRQSEGAYDHLELEPRRDYADPETYQGDQEDASAKEAPLSPVVKPQEAELPHHKYLDEKTPPPAFQAADEPAAPEETPAKDEVKEEDPVSDEGGYRLTRDSAGETPAAPAQRRPRRRAARNRPQPEDEE